MQTEMSSIAYWRFMLACWQTCGYFSILTNNVNKKMNKKALFLAFRFFVVFGDKAGNNFIGRSGIDNFEQTKRLLPMWIVYKNMRLQP